MSTELINESVDWLTIILALLSAIVGTYGGVYFSSKMAARKSLGVRDIAINMLGKIKEYDKLNNTYRVTQEDFNKTFSTAEKKSRISCPT